VRCCVIANGCEAYKLVVKNPKEMPKDVTFESLLSVAKIAYQRKTGQIMRYSPSFPIETFSNKAGWNLVCFSWEWFR
jgi:hypothetical protein